MKKFAALGSVALIALSLTACSSNSATAEPANSATPSAVAADSTSQAPASAAPAESQSAPSQAAENQNLSERGNPIIQLGEKTTVKNKDGQPLVEYTLTKLDPNPKCTNGTGWTPTNGHFVALEVEVQTFKGVKEVAPGGWTLQGYDFKAIRPDGTTSNADAVTTSSLNCLQSKDRIVEMSDNEKGKGWVVIDVEEPKGTLVYDDSYSDVTWELAYPAN